MPHHASQATADRQLMPPRAAGVFFLLFVALTGMAIAVTTAQASDTSPTIEKPTASIEVLPLVGQKGPRPDPAPTQETETFVTNPGGSIGGLVFANIDDLVLLAAEQGAATVERDDDGNRYIAAKIDGLNYVIDVYNCEPDCADLTLTASFTLNGITIDQVNEWNRTRRFGKAYLAEDGDAVIQLAINTRHGITVETFRDDLIWWENILPEYAEFIGFR